MDTPHAPPRNTIGPSIAAIIFAVVLSAVLILAGIAFRNELANDAKERFSQRLTNRGILFSRAIERRVSLLDGLKAHFLTNTESHDHVFREFNDLSRAIDNAVSGIVALTITAPDGTATYPASMNIQKYIPPAADTAPLVIAPRTLPDERRVIIITKAIENAGDRAELSMVVDINALLGESELNLPGDMPFAIINENGGRIAGSLIPGEFVMSAPAVPELGWLIVASGNVPLSGADRKVMNTFAGFSVVTVILASLMVNLLGRRHMNLRQGYAKAHDALHVTESKYHLLFQNIGDAVLLADAETGIILEVNDAATGLWGYDRETFTGIHQAKLHPPKDEHDKDYRGRFDEHVNDGGGVDTEAVIRRADGHDMPVLVSSSITELEGRKIIIGVFRDITAMKQLEANLQEMNRNLELRVQKEVALRREQEHLIMQQSKLAAMGELLGALSHEWRQPLNTVGLVIQNLPDQMESGTLTVESLEKAVLTAMEQIKGMSGIINRFSHIHHAGMEPKEFHPTTELKEILKVYAPGFHQIGIRISMVCDFDPETDGTPHAGDTIDGFDFTCMQGVKHEEDEHCTCPPRPAYGSLPEFRQAMVSLLTNAKDAITERRESDPRATPDIIHIDSRIEGETAKISVEDTGGGIPDELMDRVFEPYFTTKRPHRGTGLGLYSARIAIVQGMGGSIHAENTEKGARITITLPLGKTIEA